MIRLWCEWDLGQDSLIFTNEDKAIDWLQKALQVHEYLFEDFENATAIIDEGLAGFHILTVI